MSKTVNTFHPETRSLFQTLRDNGFTITGGNNGEENFPRGEFSTETAFLNELLACDEASLFVKRQGLRESKKTPGKMIPAQYWLFLVLGNSPGELVCDYGIPSHTEDAAALDKATNEHARKWEGRKQPTETEA
jgi:hypothetical protein